MQIQLACQCTRKFQPQTALCESVSTANSLQDGGIWMNFTVSKHLKLSYILLIMFCVVLICDGMGWTVAFYSMNPAPCFNEIGILLNLSTTCQFCMALVCCRTALGRMLLWLPWFLPFTLAGWLCYYGSLLAGGTFRTHSPYLCAG